MRTHDRASNGWKERGTHWRRAEKNMTPKKSEEEAILRMCSNRYSFTLQKLFPGPWTEKQTAPHSQWDIGYTALC